MKKLIGIMRNVPQHWVGDGFPVQTLFSYAGDTAAVDPFVLLDYAAPYEFQPGKAPRGVGEHPHRGFETVTVMYQGELEHRDSAGNHGTIGPGDVQWMTAASGVVHEEFHSAAFTAQGGLFEVAQLWVNLPAAYKMSSPRYQETHAADIPEVTLQDDAGTARVIAGEFDGTIGPAKTFTPIILLDLRLQAGSKTSLPLPDGYTTMAVLTQGRTKFAGAKSAESVALATFSRAGSGIEIEAVDDTRSPESRLLVLCGEPIGEPVVGRGPFVMNTEAELRQAMIDYQTGKMGSLS
jgi:redox-sensitive bicupin YhaK (pirin superfamily)